MRQTYFPDLKTIPGAQEIRLISNSIFWSSLDCSFIEIFCILQGFWWLSWLGLILIELEAQGDQPLSLAPHGRPLMAWTEGRGPSRMVPEGLGTASEWVRGLESNTLWQSSTLRMEPTKWGVRNSFSDRGVTSSVRSPWQQIHSWVKTWQGGKQGPRRLVSPTQPSRTSFHSNYCRSWFYRLWASRPSLVTGLTRETEPT